MTDRKSNRRASIRRPKREKTMLKEQSELGSGMARLSDGGHDVACGGMAGSAASQPQKPLTEKPWREAVISVTDPDVTARFFKEIGGYEELGRGRYPHPPSPPGISAGCKRWYLLLRGSMGGDFGHVRLVSFIMRQADAHAPGAQHGIPRYTA